MAIPIRTPRVNNNDDVVRFTRIHRPPGSFVRKGEIIAEIETDKASFTVEVEEEGHVLAFVQPLDEMIPVGSVLAWLGRTADEPIPDAEPASVAAADSSRDSEPTLKAALLLARYGLSAAEVRASSGRLSAEDVLAHVERRGVSGRAPSPATRAAEPDALIAGARVPLSVAERGMLRTVLWHRETAVPGYVEIDYETPAWDRYAAAYQDRHKLLMNPLLSLMAYRLVQLALKTPKLNSTIVDHERHEYSVINLGFTIQSGSRLTLLSLRDAGSLGEQEFVDALGLLMRQGMKEKLTAEQTSGVTVSFTSMARWQVRRHVPVLAPYTSLIVAHSQGRDGIGVLGASYDHRVLTGGEVAVVLRELSAPAEGEEPA